MIYQGRRAGRVLTPQPPILSPVWVVVVNMSTQRDNGEWAGHVWLPGVAVDVVAKFAGQRDEATGDVFVEGRDVLRLHILARKGGRRKRFRVVVPGPYARYEGGDTLAVAGNDNTRDVLNPRP